MRIISIILAALALFLGVVTFSILSGFKIFGIQPKYLLAILAADVTVLLLLGITLSKKLVELWVERRQGLAGSKIHVRFTMLFGFLAAMPAIIMTVFSITFFHFGIQEWFSEKVRSSLEESVAVAKSYEEEHQRHVAKDASLMVQDVVREFSHLARNRQEFDRYLTLISSIRSLTEAIVFAKNNDESRLLGRSNLTFALQFEAVPSWALEMANSGKVAVLNSEYHDRVRALIQLPGMHDIYLFVGRSVDPAVLEHLKKAEESFQQYNALEGQRTGFELIVIIFFTVVALLLLGVSIWLGLVVAGEFILPIRHLIDASQKIRRGDLSVRVPEKKIKNDGDEFYLLSYSFNRMARQLEKQQRDLLLANEKLEGRRRFIESTLEGVSSGVVRLDKRGRILYPNQIISEMFKVDFNKNIEKKLGDVIPGLSDGLKAALKLKKPLFEDQITLMHQGVKQTFVMHVVAEHTNDSITGYVVTLDEVTGLIAAQKQAAWSDVARRVAHEIKNPLTPIHLAAERLKSKYFKQIKESPAIFLECVDTIIRQVTYIGHMVTEFSAFARMPIPIFKKIDLNLICEHIFIMQKNSFQTIHFELKKWHTPLFLNGDERLISQALLNVVKNSIEALLENGSPADTERKITISARETEKEIILEVADNGSGFPLDTKENLIDPYVTTRSKGTGLGLAIVQRVMEDHNGRLKLRNRKEGQGAVVSLEFSKIEGL
jgi:two-component system nitrogen regulation sensor histidine kinase NtrY